MEEYTLMLFQFGKMRLFVKFIKDWNRDRWILNERSLDRHIARNEKYAWKKNELYLSCNCGCSEFVRFRAWMADDPYDVDTLNVGMVLDNVNRSLWVRIGYALNIIFKSSYLDDPHTLTETILNVSDVHQLRKACDAFLEHAGNPKSVRAKA